MHKFKCSLCENDKQKIVYDSGRFKVVRCLSCGLGLLLPQPSEKSLDNFYSRDYFKKDSDSFGYKNYIQMERSLNNEAERKISFIKKFSKRSSTLLDVGAGLGNFAVCASYNGFKVEILDRSKWAVGYVKKNFNIEGYVSTLYESKLPEAKFDIVTAWDVIEHLTNPLLGFKTLNMLLKRSGFLFLTTPNIDSIDSKILGKRWYGFKKIPEHVVYFSPSTIRLFAERTGFEVLEIKNWGFVRNWQFMADKLKIYNARLGGLFEKQLKFIGIQNKDVYFPFIDMMVVLKKR
ncbi:MAG: Methyltransferase type 12 [Microgenomates group bacterium GW2011_GWA2_44_7]|nr:MAG: Methyltransferase type 12 [Microgenomates group bacterium GW2011_GWA2_44_7]